MNALRTFETKLAELYEQLPHLPQNGRRWLAANVWWVVLIIAIISSIGLLVAIPALLAIAGLSAYASIYAYNTIPTTLRVTSAVVSLGFGVISAILLWLAVKPLKLISRRGWKLLFVNQVVAILSAVVTFIVLIQNFNLLGLIWSLVLIAVEMYFLFEIRGEFGAKVTTNKARAARAVEAEVVAAPKK